MNIVTCFKRDNRGGQPVICYADSVVRELEIRGHHVTMCGEGHDIESLEQLDQKDFDFLLEVENGRNSAGELFFQQGKHLWRIPSAVWLIDSHGHPEPHKAASKRYNHVFFAVWSKRDLYAKHPSAHWCPNATDLKWFNGRDYANVIPTYVWGFFGSKGGLPRADPLVEVCRKHAWSHDVRQVTKARRHKWPMCAEAMAKCLYLFNHGQKHDGPNQRVMESMAMGCPLLTDMDPKDGMDKLFVEGYHYVGYESYTYKDLEDKMWWMMDNPEIVKTIAKSAYEEVVAKHTVGTRVHQIMEVVCGSDPKEDTGEEFGGRG